MTSPQSWPEAIWPRDAWAMAPSEIQARKSLRRLARIHQRYATQESSSTMDSTAKLMRKVSQGVMCGGVNTGDDRLRRCPQVSPGCPA